MPYRDKIIPWLAVLAWLACTAYAIWYFELRDQRPFENAHTALFDPSARAESAESWLRRHAGAAASGVAPAKATVVHVFNAGCPCNRFTDQHLAEILARYRAAGVRFIAASVSETDATADGLRPVDRAIQSELTWIDSTPAALVYDAAGKLMYYGPYSDSAECGSSGGGRVERVLDRVLLGQTQSPQKFYGGGCFCTAKHRA